MLTEKQQKVISAAQDKLKSLSKKNELLKRRVEELEKELSDYKEHCDYDDGDGCIL